MPSQALIKHQHSKQESHSETSDDPVIPETPNTTESAELVALTDELLDEIDQIIEEVGPPKPFTLADAMREGAEMAPQAFGAWKTSQGETCALQASYEAIKARVSGS